MEGVVKIGPWGGQGGKAWQWGNPIQKIRVTHGEVVDSVTFGYIKNGAMVWSERFGGGGGRPSEEISIKDPEEYLVTISGTIGSFNNINSLVTSLTFISNKRSYGPYGKSKGNQFSIPLEGGKIVGFFGRYGAYMDAIGFNLVPLGYPQPTPPVQGNVKVVGPWGGRGGKSWTYGGPIQKILVKYGTVVDSITFGFIKDGTTVWSGKFGGDGGQPREVNFSLKISLKEPEEYVVTVKGTTGLFLYPTPVITSLTFITNKGTTYGPYGKETADKFSYSAEGPIVGFHGRCGQFLDAIGVNVVSLGLPQPIPPI